MPTWVTDHVCFSGATITPERCPALAKRDGITAVLNLRAEAQDVFVEPMPGAYLWLPVVDHGDPTVEQLLTGAQFVDAMVRADRRVLVHCKMGIGRSPTMVAAYLVWTG